MFSNSHIKSSPLLAEKEKRNDKITSFDTYIGLGGNLGNPKVTLISALAAIAALPHVTLIAVSSFYRTTPWGVTARQPAYLNATARVLTSLSPEDLLRALHHIEREHKRARRYRYAPRALDLDILLYGDTRKKSSHLTLPHPRLFSRAFALVPLLEILPPTSPHHARCERSLRLLGDARREVKVVSEK